MPSTRPSDGIVVLKIGGSVSDEADATLDLVASLADGGRPLVVVHGGGPQVGEWAARLGLGLWNSIPATIVVEGLMFAAGVWMYRATTLARDRIGHYGFVSLVALLIVLYADAAQGSPPPSVQVLKTVSLGIWMFPFLAAWVDRHRAVIQPVGAPREAHLKGAAGQARPRG